MSDPYDPPIDKSSRRGRSTSFSASSAPSPSVFQNPRTRRQSLSSVPTSDFKRPGGALSDEEADTQQPLIDLEENFRRSLDGRQTPADAAADRANQREGRQSKQQRLEENPNYHATNDMEQFMAQLYDLTHTIDALDNDIDSIVAMRNKIVSLKPSVDVGQVSLQADLHALAALTTESGKRIVSLETWLLSLHKWSKDVRKLIKEGKAGETIQEVGEIKFELANARLDFAGAMERIREGAYKEQEKRQRTRIWMARHIRSREPEIEDQDVVGLLKAAEMGAADGVAESHVTSYAGLWALQNPFTELAELTNGMRFLYDEVDRDIVDHLTGKAQPKRIIYTNGVYSRARPNLSGPTPSSSAPPASDESSETQPPKKFAISQPSSWFNSRSSSSAQQGKASQEDEGKYRYMQAKAYASEKDLEYGFARQQQLDRMSFRKKMVVALLLVVIAALILFVSLAVMKVPGEGTNVASAIAQEPSSTFAWGDEDGDTSTTPAAASATDGAATSSHGKDDTKSEKDADSTSSAIANVLSSTSGMLSATQTRNVVTFSSNSLAGPSLAASAAATVPTLATSSSVVWWTPEMTPAVAQGVGQ